MLKKKILFVSHAEDIGGGEICLSNTILSLNNYQDFDLMLLAPNGLLANSLRSKIPVVFSKGIGRLNRKSRNWWFIEFIWRYIISFIECCIIIIKFKPTLVYCFSETSLFYTVVPAKLLGKKIICDLHFIVSKNRFWAQLSRLMGRFISNYLTVSNAVKNRLIEIGHNQDKILLLMSGIDTQFKFNPSLNQRGFFNNYYAIPQEDVLIGIIGSVCELKGQHIFLEAVDIINNFDENKSKINVKYLIIGEPLTKYDETYINALRKFVINNNLSHNVVFTGQLTHDQIPSVLIDIDIIIFSSVLPDALPLSILEAMSMEKIVIASKIGGVPEIIENGNTGFLYEPGNSQELATHIRHVIENISILKKMGDRARKSVIRKFSQEVFRKNLIATISKIYSN